MKAHAYNKLNVRDSRLFSLSLTTAGLSIGDKPCSRELNVLPGLTPYAAHRHICPNIVSLSVTS